MAPTQAQPQPVQPPQQDPPFASRLHGQSYSPDRIEELQSRKTDLCGVIAAPLALIGFCLLPAITGPAAFILGLVSWYRIQGNRELVGKDFAIAGIVLGALCTLWGGVGWLLTLGLLFH